MVKGILNFFSSEQKGVHQAAFLLAISGILADILALLRDRLLASHFGASRALDLYYVSFRVPDFIYTLSLFFAASTALIPIILDKFRKDQKAGEEFLSNILSFFSVVVLFLVVVAYFLMPFIISYAAPGFSGDERTSVILLSRILLLSPLFLGLSNLVSSVIQSFRRFYIYSLSPLLYNFGIIFGILFFMPRYGLPGIVWGVVLGALGHLLIQLPSAISLGFKFKLKPPKFSDDVKEALKLSAPRTLGLSLNQIVLTVITAIGSTLGAGAVAVLNLASNLQSVPLTVIGLSYSVGAFPTLAASFAKEDKKEFLKYFSVALRHIIFWSLPATVLFIVLRAQIVRVVLGAGAFSWFDTRLTAASLLLLSISILAQGLVYLLVRAFYAAGKTMLPLIVNLISSVATIGSAFWFLLIFRSSDAFRIWFQGVLKVSDISGTAILILPLAVSLGSIVNIILLFYFFKKTFGGLNGGMLSRSLHDSLISSLMVGVSTYYALKFFSLVLNLETFVGIFLQGFFSGLIGLAVGAVILYRFSNREFKELAEAFHSKIWRRVMVVASEPEKLP